MYIALEVEHSSPEEWVPQFNEHSNKNNSSNLFLLTVTDDFLEIIDEFKQFGHFKNQN